MARSGGFTLIELMVVVVILGILASIAIPNYLRAQEGAKLAYCRSNQKHISVAATAWALENGVLDANINCLVLFDAGLIRGAIAECPNSNNPDHDDYDIVITGSVAREMTCRVMGAAHLWEVN